MRSEFRSPKISTSGVIDNDTEQRLSVKLQKLEFDLFYSV